MNYFESSKETLKAKKKDLDEEDEYDGLIGRYEVNNEETDSQRTSIFIRRQRKQISFPFIFYIFIFAILLFFGIFGLLIYEFLDISLNYSYDDKPFEKSILSNYNYTNLTFKNGLEVLLVQTEENQMAGGSITFDYSNLDSSYKFGDLKLVMNSIISENIFNSSNLSEYLGNYKISEEENSFSFSFSFSILNEGFFEYLKILKNLTYIEDKDERFNESNFKKVKNITKRQIKRINKGEKENYILKYFVYGYQKVLPNDSNLFLNDRTNDSIKEISKSLLKPHKIKIVLASRFKPSLMTKKFLKYFQNIANCKNEIQNKTLSNSSNINENDTIISTQKIIYFKTKEHEGNYIKINYYIDKNEKETFEEFYEKQGYFNYLKYILDEINEDSLFHLLVNNPNYTIKSLEPNFKIILKNKIEFSLRINLAPSSYKYLDDIIFLTFQYMNKFIKHINNMNSNDERLKELDIITNQNFTFQEDGIDNVINFTKILARNLCDKKNKRFFLNRRWIPPFNIEDIKDYFSLLTPEKSVIILALNENNINKCLNINSKFKFNLTKFKENNIPFFNINFSYCDFDTDFKKYFNENEITIPFHNNSYISNYLKAIDIDEKNKEFNIKKTNLSNFTFYRDTRFRLPKVYISLNLFHPYMRPYNESKMKDCIYFESILYLAFIKREIQLKLSDAIRAGNSIRVGFNQNHMYIDIFAFSDVASTIVEKIRNIMNDTNSFKKIHDFDDINKFEFYMKYSFEEILTIEKTLIDRKSKFYFYYALNENIYKTYEFPLKDLKDFKNKCGTIFNDINELITYFYLDCHIYGFYEEDNATKIANLFKEFERSEENFQNVLDKAGLRKENLTSNTFKDWMLKLNLYDEKTIKKDLIIDKKYKNYISNRFIYIYWSNYSIINRVKSNIFRKILKKSLFKHNLILEMFYYNNIYLVLQDTSKNNSRDYDSEIKKLNQTIYCTYNDTNKIEYYKKEIDSIGSTLYYLIKNMIQSQYLRTKDMISTAKTHLHSDFYTFDNYSDLKEKTPDLKKLNYDYFLKHFNETVLKSYIDIHYNYSK